jgi:Ca-activated chloride channel family protein
MDNFRFAHPEYLYLLLLIPILWAVFIYASRLRRKRIELFGKFELMMELMPNVSFFRPKIKFFIQLLALFFLIVVLAQPQYGTKQEETKRKGIEIMIALDVSNSMLAQDVTPSRMDYSKQFLTRLVDVFNEDKLGLIVFAGDAYTQLPITVDYVSAKMFISSISNQMVARQGTAIGSAIDQAINSFGTKGEAGRAIIIITDGENHEDDAVAAAKLAAENGIVVHVIGMGKPEGAPIPVPNTMSFWKDKQGNVVVSKLNEQMCKEIAAAGKGVYVRADNSNNAFKVITKELDGLSKSEIKSNIFSDYNDQFQSFVLLVLFLLILDFYIFDRKNKQFGRFRIFELKDKFLNSVKK